MEKKSGARGGVKTAALANKKPKSLKTPAFSGAGKILDTAERLFSKKGFDSVSMNEIARAAGASKANIFHHFGSKKDLYIAVVRRCMSDCADEMTCALNGATGFEERLRAFARGHLDRLFTRERVTRLISRALLDGGERLGRDLAEKVLCENFSRLVNVIVEGAQTGALRREADPAMAAILLVSANLFFFESRSVFRHFPSVDFGDDRDRYSEKLMDILLNGILKPGAEPKRDAKRVSRKKTGESKKRGV